MKHSERLVAVATAVLRFHDHEATIIQALRQAANAASTSAVLINAV